LDELLLCIARNSGRGELKTSTGRLAAEIGISQQSISRKLRSLEQKGLILRASAPSGMTISIKEKGLLMLKSEYMLLKGIFESTSKINGKVTSGMGEGGYYVKIYSGKFRKMLGFAPFPGTLNIKVDPASKKVFLAGSEQITIPEFRTKTRTFGVVHCYKVRIGKSVKGALIAPVRARHPENIAELIAPINLRRKFSLMDGSEISVERDGP